MMKRGLSVATCLVLLAMAAPGRAEVTRLEIRTRDPFAGGQSFGTVGPYEKITGRLHYAVDPRNPANARIVDLEHAPRNDRGHVEFVGDFILLKPVDLAKGNHRILYEVNNRGNLGMLARLNRARGSNNPSAPEHAGNGFLMRRGYTVLWSAWNWDVIPGNERLEVELPIATDQGRTITGTIVAEITVNQRALSQPVAWGNSRGYEAVDPSATSDATLTVRDHQRDARVEIPPDRWRFARVEGDQGAATEIVEDPTHVYLSDGFEPGRLYELVYTAKDPRVVGLGLAGIRDAISFFRFATSDQHGNESPLTVAASGAERRPDAETAYIFGISQSGRVINHMVFEGFHVDEQQRMVFDAGMPHVAGSGKGSFNHRFAQTTRHASHMEDYQYPADFFPFTLAPQVDPITGEVGDVLGVARQLGKIPLLMYTGTSTEYWTRSTSLLHTNVSGTADAPVDPQARIYFIAGAQHGIGRSRARGIYEHPGNTLDHSPPLRALLVALDRWATDGTMPPASVYPRLDRGELITAAEHRRRFPGIPGARHPGSNLQPPRLDFGPRFWTDGIIDTQPPTFGAPYVTLVPNLDADGTDIGGIRLPDVSVPLGTHLGWNPRQAEVGNLDYVGRWAGSFLAFPPTEAERARSADPRPSIEARYPSHQDYVERVRSQVGVLVGQGFLLEEDARAYVENAEGLAWPPDVTTDTADQP